VVQGWVGALARGGVVAPSGCGWGRSPCSVSCSSSRSAPVILGKRVSLPVTHMRGGCTELYACRCMWRSWHLSRFDPHVFVVAGGGSSSPQRAPPWLPGGWSLGGGLVVFGDGDDGVGDGIWCWGWVVGWWSQAGSGSWGVWVRGVLASCACNEQ
jgi:hypothetical protein